MSKKAQVVMFQGRNTQFDKLVKTVESAGLDAQLVKNASALLQIIIDTKPSILMLDLHYDEMDAIDMLQQLQHRGMSNLLTVVVFGDGEEHYVEIAALNAGADDYLIKPVNKRILASRLNAWMRRQSRLDAALGKPTRKGSFNLDRERYSLMVSNNEVALQRKEFEIISLLASRPRKVFSRKEIKEIVWGSADKAKNRTIDVHITNLRSKIGPDFIKTYKGVGYSFDG